MPVKFLLIAVILIIIFNSSRTQPSFKICNTIKSIKATPPTSSQTGNVLGKKYDSQYGINGTLIYSDFNADGETGTYQYIPSSNLFWRLNNTDGGPFNRCAIWDKDGLFDSLGFSVCVPILKDGDYYMGFAADNYAGLKIDGKKIIQYRSENYAPYYTVWRIFKIHLSTGKHYVEILGYNAGRTGGGDPAAIGFEIYNNTAEQIIKATSYSNLDIVFSTRNQVGQQAQVGNPQYTYTCPAGYSLDFCAADVPVCSKIVLDTISVTVTQLAPVCAPGIVNLTDPAITKTSKGDLVYSWWQDAEATKRLDNADKISASGTYYIKGETNNFCADIKPLQVTIYPQPVVKFNINNANQCIVANNYKLTNVSTITSGSFSSYCSFGDGTNIAAPDAAHNYATTGNYTLKLICTSNNGCIDSAKQTVQVTAKPYLGRDLDKSFCEGYGVNVNELYNLKGYQLVKWSMPNPQNTAMAGIDTVIVTDKNGCRDTATVSLVQLPSAASQFDTTLCYGDVFEGYNAAGTYTKLFKMAASNGCDSTRTIHLSFYPRALGKIDTTICYPNTFEGHNVSGTYIKHTVTKNGKCDSTITINLTVLHLPDAYVTLVKDTVVCPGENILLKAGNFDAYTWQDGSSLSTYNVTIPGTYNVSVTNYCGTTAGTTVVKPRLCDIYLPSAFTPNRDGKNDDFKALNAYGISSFMLRVYNRVGQKVFETRDVSKSWGGQINGLPQTAGTFVWYCEYIKAPGTPKVFLKGTVLLIR